MSSNSSHDFGRGRSVVVGDGNVYEGSNRAARRIAIDALKRASRKKLKRVPVRQGHDRNLIRVVSGRTDGSSAFASYIRFAGMWDSKEPRQISRDDLTKSDDEISRFITYLKRSLERERR